MPCFKSAGERSSPSQYCAIGHVSIINIFLEYIINQKIVDHLNKNNILSDRKYRHRFFRFTYDLLNVIAYKIIETLDNKFITRAMALDILKTCDKV